MENENKNFYNEDISHILDRLDSNEKTGLTPTQLVSKLDEFGYNKLEEKKKSGFIRRVFRQFADFLVLILIIAAGLSYYVGSKKDAILIISIVILNAILGIYQEGKAEKSIESLKNMESSQARVLRNSIVGLVDAETLIPGDIVYLQAGDIVPADLRLIESSQLQIEESSLTGESIASDKDSGVVLDDDTALADRVNMAYMSTIVTYGRGVGVVVGTGTNTEIGKIANLIQSYDDESTPLQNQLNKLGKSLGTITIIVSVLIFLLGFFQGKNPIDMFMLAISLAVAAIPEGLPAIVTIVLALGMNRMAKRNALVKKLLAVETLGSTSVICTDKTGTLTENQMTVVNIYTDRKILKVTGRGYTPVGDILYKDKPVSIDDIGDLETILAGSSLCNDASLESKNGNYKAIGDPTEAALISLSGKCDFSKELMEKNYPRLKEIPFDSDRKIMTTFHEGYIPDGIIAFTKGAPDVVIERCSKISQGGKILDFTQDLKDEVMMINKKFSYQALRVLAIAYRDYDKLPEEISSENNENNLTFVGLVAMVDPSRPEARRAIYDCKKAGIRPVMITGDYKETAFAIAKDLGIASYINEAVLGSQLDNLDDDELKELVKHVSVYSRVSPEHKVRIVTALKDNGHIVAMTGDGVNDAPALKKSDIGVAMGITGSDVAKDTANLILMDDDFSTIVHAVEEGRIIYANIRKFVAFLLSCNIAEILLILSSMLLNLPIPLLPVQLLWLNLVTDSFPALALGVEEGEPNIMKEKPRDPNEPILNKSLRRTIILQSIVLAGVSIYAFKYGLNKYPTNINKARSMVFSCLILAELLRAYSSRSEKYSVFKLGIFSNKKMVLSTSLSLILLVTVIYLPLLQNIFNTVALSFDDIKLVGTLALIPFILGEFTKLFKKK